MGRFRVSDLHVESRELHRTRKQRSRKKAAKFRAAENQTANTKKTANTTSCKSEKCQKPDKSEDTETFSFQEPVCILHKPNVN